MNVLPILLSLVLLLAGGEELLRSSVALARRLYTEKNRRHRRYVIRPGHRLTRPGIYFFFGQAASFTFIALFRMNFSVFNRLGMAIFRTSHPVRMQYL
ncbi:MAG: hypothetical protein H6859_09700 [Rhodospirillales bacterium]|nr:hypothetical protein [Alphaproteobacteria bacterium]USO05399.1 MAG: hypothetical protein H6859_09700 [Rhodospirillales bacterium]